jgi:hypothetical protein
MAENLDVLNTAVSLLVRAVLLAARFSGRVRRRGLKQLGAMDADAKAWEITKANLSWGRMRIANQLQLLGIFLSVSTVRNIPEPPKPRDTPVAPATREKPQEKPEAREPGLTSDSMRTLRSLSSTVLSPNRHAPQA